MRWFLLLLSLLLVVSFVRCDEDAAAPADGEKAAADAAEEVKKDEEGNEIEGCVGIDLGTTYSCVGAYKNGRVEIIPNDQGNRITPSWVAFTETERLIGDAAKNQAALNPTNTIFDVKRLIGRMYADPSLQRDKKLLPYRINQREGKPVIAVQYLGEEKEFAPEEISAMVLSKMKEIAETSLGHKVSHAVVTVPAYFNDAQRRATRNAGTIASLHVLRIINEPTASAIAYGLDEKDVKNILVFDLGGGTFDVSVLTLEDKVFEVLATNGDTHLGGEDFDNNVVAWVVQQFKQKTGLDPSKNLRSMSKLKREAERAKRTLSYEFTVKVEIENFFEGHDLSETLSRSKFESLNMDLFKNTIVPVQKAMKDAKLEKSEISEILLVGGSTRIPKIQALIKEYFDGKEPNSNINPDEAVAYGAALQAGVLCGISRDSFTLMDVIPLSLGVANDQGMMEVLIPRNSPIPTNAQEQFTTVVDNQPTVLFEVYEGERALAKKNHLLGSFELKGIPPARRGVPEITVSFEIDRNGILSCSAEDKATGSRESVTITRDKQNLSKEDIQRMQEEAADFAEEDRIARERAEARGKLDGYVYQVRTSFETIRMKVPKEERKKADKLIVEAYKWTDRSSDAEAAEINKQRERLEKKIQPLFDRFYKLYARNKPFDDDTKPEEKQDAADGDDAEADADAADEAEEVELNKAEADADADADAKKEEL